MKKLIVLLLLCSVIIVNSCGYSSDTNSDSDSPTPSPTFNDEDDQYYFRHYSIGDMTMAASKDGYYFFSGPGDHYLYFMDKKTLNAIPVCNKPECLHGDETDLEKKSNCNAFFLNNHANLMYYKSNLYVLDGFADRQNGSRSIYQISLDGTQRKKIYTFKELIEAITIHRGYIYYAISDNGTIAGKESSTNTTTSLYRISISNTANGPELLFTGKGIYNTIGCLTGYKDGVYFISYNYKAANLDEMNSALYRYDVYANTTTAIRSDVGAFSIVSDKIFYYWTDTKMHACSIDGSKTENINLPFGIIYGDDVNIFNDTLAGKVGNRKVKRELIVTDMEGKILHIYDIDDFGMDFVYGGDDSYFFLRDISKTNAYGTITSIWAIDKNKIRSGNWTMAKVFEFVPKVQDSGYLMQN